MSNDVSRDSRVVVVNSNHEDFEPYGNLIPYKGYFVDFIESPKGAVGKIRKWQPSLVVLFVHLDRPQDFQLLSMLKLDPATREIPVVTMVDEIDEADDDESKKPSSSESQDEKQERKISTSKASRFFN